MVVETLKRRAKELGLWNLFLSKEYPEGAGTRPACGDAGQRAPGDVLTVLPCRAAGRRPRPQA